MTTRKEILDALFELCPSEYFDRRIGGRRPNNRIRSTICHPQETLASLERRFPERDLIAAGVAKRDPFGELQIVPELCQTRGLIMALRKSSTEPPCDLVTVRGSLVGRHPVLSALADGRRAALALSKPSARSKAVALAEVSRLAHEQSMTVHEQLSKASLGAGPSADGSGPSDALQQYLSMIDRMVALGKQVT